MRPRLRVAFVVNDLQLSGGVTVVVEHAQRLVRHGIDAELVLARAQAEPDWGFAGLGDLPVHGMEVARQTGYDVVVATWWETVGPALELPGKRHAYFIQSLEDRFYRPGEPQRLAAALTHDLPLPVITEARWIAETLESLHPQRRCLYVRNGIAKDVFASPEAPPLRREGPLRVLIEGNSAWFKGVPEALASVRAMQQPRHVTVVSPGGELPEGADVRVGPLSQRDLAATYANADVVLKLSRVEGMFGPPLEAFHLGATCVVSAVTGHDEYVEHGENGLVVEWDDVRGTSRALDLLARDRMLLHRLRWGALATARGWPSWDQQATVMAAALREVARREPLPAGGFDARMVAEVRGGIEAHALVVAERDRLQWRLRPVDAVQRALESPGLSWAGKPTRRAWSAARKRVGR
jgi:glycosyltransferase involved in cell wall biosynthesis